jgi:DNA-binding transcriptional ArsR family regulator
MIERMPARNVDAEAGLFQALASPLRLRMLELLLASGGMTVTEMQQRLGIEAANASQHLRVLRDRGLVQRRRERTSHWYAVVDPALRRVLHEASSIVERRGGTDALSAPARADISRPR